MANPFYARYIPKSATAAKVYSYSEDDTSLLTKKHLKASDSTTNTVRSKNQKSDRKANPIQPTKVPRSDGSEHASIKKKKKKKEHSESSVKSISAASLSHQISDDSIEKTTNSTLESSQLSTSKCEKAESHKTKEKKRVLLQLDAAKEEALQNENAKHGKIRARFENSFQISNPTSKSTNLKSNQLEEQKTVLELPVKVHGLEPIPQPFEYPEAEFKPALSALPDWIEHPVVATLLNEVPLNTLCIHPNSLDSLRRRGHHDAFAVQAVVLPMLLPGPTQHLGDMCISAATGSGKTLAYALPMVEDLRDRPTTKLRGLVLVPTRELVTQVRDTFEMFASGSGLKIGTAVGSRSTKDEQGILVERDHKYDPDAYQADQENYFDEDKELLYWDTDIFDSKANESDYLRDYVISYTSKVDILICTPGRLVEHIRSTKGFTLDNVQWLVIDEADRLLDESFQQWVDVVMPALESQIPLSTIEQYLHDKFHLYRPRKVRKIVLSATMTKDIGKISALKLSRPKLVVLETRNAEASGRGPQNPDGVLPETRKNLKIPPPLREDVVSVGDVQDKPLYFVQFLQNLDAFSKDMKKLHRELGQSKEWNQRKTKMLSDVDTSSNDSATSPSTSSDGLAYPNKDSLPNPFKPALKYNILVFANNNENALRLARLLALLKPHWESQIGTLTKSSTSSSSRKVLSAFRGGRLSVLVASDRAARGLDIPDLAHVINYDMPASVTSYIHRVGRTARAGKGGRATTLVAHHEARWFWNEIASSMNVQRGPDRKVKRVEPITKFGVEKRRRYVEALKALGQEARGENT